MRRKDLFFTRERWGLDSAGRVWMGIGLILTLSLLILAPAVAQDKGFETKVTDVAVFKNGYAFILREGEVQPQAMGEQGTWATTSQIPQALLGTFWAYSLTPEVKVTQLKSGKVDVTKTVPVRSLDDLLLVSLGKTVKLGVSRGSRDGYVIEEPMEGVLVFANGQWAGEKPSPPAEAVAPPPSRRDVYPPPRLPTDVVVLKTSTGVVALPRDRVVSVSIPGEPTEGIKDRETMTTEERLAVALEGTLKEGVKPKVGFAYMTKGIRWIPAYELSLLDEKTCRLRLQANVIDDIEDLEGASLHFVVGVPHFVMEETLSPLSLKEAFMGLSSYFVRAGTPAGAAMMSQSMAYSNVTGGYPYATGPAGPSTPEPAFLPAASPALVPGPLPSPFEETGHLATAGAEDLFLYKKENIWLEKGDRAALDIFQAEVPYSHIYKWDITGTEEWTPPQQRERERTPEQLAAELLKDKVWHCLRLENKTDVPWTTAPAMTMQEWRPLGQDLLNYTPVGGKADVKITIASDVGARKEEEEVTREKVQVPNGGYWGDLVTVNGKLYLENFKKEKVALEVSRTVQGEITEASEGGVITKAGYRLEAMNPTSIVKWEFELSPGEKKELAYTFKINVPRNY